tara:strand:+ start:608 stop:796 length:189 start_codon:yes stop_codon:yes gene_type:complete
MSDPDLVHIKSCISHHVTSEGLKLLDRQEVQFKMLRSTPDCLNYLVGLRSSQHENHVVRRFL